MSNVPYVLKGARWGQRMGHGELTDALLEGLTDPLGGYHMGETAENLAEKRHHKSDHRLDLDYQFLTFPPLRECTVIRRCIRRCIRHRSTTPSRTHPHLPESHVNELNVPAPQTSGSTLTLAYTTRFVQGKTIELPYLARVAIFGDTTRTLPLARAHENATRLHFVSQSPQVPWNVTL